MRLKTALTITGLTLLFMAAAMNDGEATFLRVFIVIGAAVPVLIAADLLHRREQERREERERWKIPDEYTN